MELKKIIFYYPDMYVGGVEMAILNLAKRIYKDYDLYFFYRSISDLDLAREFNKYGIMRNIANLKPNDECDILVYCSLWTEADDQCSEIQAKRKFLWTHAIIPPGGNKFYHLPTMRKIDEIIVVSEATKDSIPMKIYCGRFDNKIHVINNILNTQEIKEKSMLPPPDLKLAQDLNICTVARLSHEKGWLRIRYLCQELQKLNIDFKWFIVGEGYTREHLHRIHLMLDNIPQIQFVGKLLNPFPVVKQMDYLALLSDYESWGLAITEGKILNVPILVTDFPAAFEQVSDDYNGIIIPKKEYQYYKDIVQRIVKNKSKYKENLKDFDYEKINEMSIKHWKEIFDGKEN
ncbi:MAG: glycosyltransferase [Bacilli bacterium]|nr:glycosyltransferase [Bacilli bacterium]